MSTLDEILIPILRTIISFIALVIVNLFIGKHINSHKNYYSFSLSIVIGSFVANMGFDMNLSFWETFFSFVALILVFYLLLLLSSRSRRIRASLTGQPTVLIEKGKILEENMKEIHFSLDDLNQCLRELGIFDIYEVEYALLEVSGELSILKKTPFQAITKKDLQAAYAPVSLPIELIMDGKVIMENLTHHYNMGWIQTECKKRNIKIEDIYYAVINSNGSLFIDCYRDNIHSTLH